jgi:type I restriction-modification system DNA methylase subunit
LLPDGVLFGSSTAHKALRKELVENHKLDGVISMPSGVFKPYAGVSTAVLIFTVHNKWQLTIYLFKFNHLVSQSVISCKRL